MVDMPRHALRAFFRRAALLVPLALAGCPPCPKETHWVYVDGGLPDALDIETCRKLCSKPLWNTDSCAPGTLDGGVQVVLCHGNVACYTGRRPAGLVTRAAPYAHEVGRYFAEAAQLEDASVHAFRHLAAELRLHDAPEALIAAADRSATEETAHRRVMGALARRFGARPLRAQVRQIAA